MAKTIRTRSENTELIARRRQEIAKAAAKLFTRKGYVETSVHDIASASGIGIGTLYHYIGSKDDILYLVVEQEMIALREVAEKISTDLMALPEREAIKQCVRILCEQVSKIEDITLLSYQEARRLDPTTNAKSIVDTHLACVEAIKALLTKCTSPKRLSSSQITLLAHETILGAEMWSTRRWVIRKAFNLQEYINTRAELLLRTLGID